MTLLVEELTVRFGGQVAVDGLTLDVPFGRITGLVGPNGSGKSTVMGAIAGTVRPAAGRVLLDGRPLPPASPVGVARAGVGRTFQIPRLARRLSVFENLLAAARDQPGERLHALFLRPGRVARAERALEAQARRVIGRIGLEPKLNTPAGELSGGQQKLLSLGMLLMGNARVMLLDEPAAGVNPVLVEDQIALLTALRDEGHAILLVEHNMAMIGRLCDRVCVLDAGRRIALGDPETVQRDPAVIASYLSLDPARAEG